MDTPKLRFKTANEAFEYACRWLRNDLAAGAVLPGLILDSNELFGRVPKPNERGIQTLPVKIASKDGGFIVLAQSASAKGPELKAGDFVAWNAGACIDGFSPHGNDPRSSWIGLILGTLELELDQSGWKGRDLFS